MTATNICYNFVGFRYSPPLSHHSGGLDGIVGPGPKWYTGGGGGGDLTSHPHWTETIIIDAHPHQPFMFAWHLLLVPGDDLLVILNVQQLLVLL